MCQTSIIAGLLIFILTQYIYGARALSCGEEVASCQEEHLSMLQYRARTLNRPVPAHELGNSTDCPGCMNFIGILNGGGSTKPTGVVARKLFEMVMQQFPGIQTINILCYEGGSKRGRKYCSSERFSGLADVAESSGKSVHLLHVKLSHHPSKFMAHLKPSAGDRQAHILTFSPGNTLTEILNLQRGRIADGQSLDKFLYDLYSEQSKKVPVVFGSSGGTNVWFDGGITGSCGCPLARIPGMGILPGLVCPHADRGTSSCGKRRDGYRSIRQQEVEWYNASESGLQLANSGTIWIQNGSVHWLEGNVKSFLGSDMTGANLPQGGTPLSSYVYGGRLPQLSTGVQSLKDLLRDFHIETISKRCFTKAFKKVSQVREDEEEEERSRMRWRRRRMHQREEEEEAEEKVEEEEEDDDAADDDEDVGAQSEHSRAALVRIA